MVSEGARTEREACLSELLRILYQNFLGGRYGTLFGNDEALVNWGIKLVVYPQAANLSFSRLSLERTEMRRLKIHVSLGLLRCVRLGFN